MAETLHRLGLVIQNASLAGSSHRTYGRSWKQLRCWCRLMRYKHLLSEKNEKKNTAQLGSYAMYLFQYDMNKKRKGNQFGTIAGKLSAV